MLGSITYNFVPIFRPCLTRAPLSSPCCIPAYKSCSVDVGSNVLDISLLTVYPKLLAQNNQRYEVVRYRHGKEHPINAVEDAAVTG